MKKLLLAGVMLLAVSATAHAQGFFGPSSGCFPGPCPPSPPPTAREIAAAKKRLNLESRGPCKAGSACGDEKAAPNQHRCAVPSNRGSPRLRRLRERRDRRTPPAPDEHNKAGDHIGHVPHPARITGGEEGVAASSPPPRQSPSSVSSARHGSP